MGKKMLATNIDAELLKDFRVACTMQEKNMNEVLEKFMREYVRLVRIDTKQPE